MVDDGFPSPWGDDPAGRQLGCALRRFSGRKMRDRPNRSPCLVALAVVVAVAPLCCRSSVLSPTAAFFAPSFRSVSLRRGPSGTLQWRTTSSCLVVRHVNTENNIRRDGGFDQDAVHSKELDVAVHEQQHLGSYSPRHNTTLSSRSRSPGPSTNRLDSSASPSSSAFDPSRWDSFDYLKHWYPVCWAVDMPRDEVRHPQPAKVTLFDVDYAVVLDRRTSKAMAFVDACPHRGAALSEGRVTGTSGDTDTRRYLQCSYHGWSFDSTGACVDIPQRQNQNAKGGSPPAPSSCSARAVPACLHQGMVWLWPGSHLNVDPALLPKPPSIPEMDMTSDGYTSCPTVRDFPMIDWTLLLSNIMDPVCLSAAVVIMALFLSNCWSSTWSHQYCLFLPITLSFHDTLHPINRTTACSRTRAPASTGTRPRANMR